MTTSHIECCLLILEAEPSFSSAAVTVLAADIEIPAEYPAPRSSLTPIHATAIWPISTLIPLPARWMRLGNASQAWPKIEPVTHLAVSITHSCQAHDIAIFQIPNFAAILWCYQRSVSVGRCLEEASAPSVVIALIRHTGRVLVNIPVYHLYRSELLFKIVRGPTGSDTTPLATRSPVARPRPDAVR